VTTGGKVFYWVMLLLNFLAGFGCGLFLLFFRLQTIWLHNPKPPEWMPMCFNISQECVMVFQIYSGVVLVRSVLKIRRFFVERDA